MVRWLLGHRLRCITLIPLLWIIATGFQIPADSIAYPPVVVFEPTLEGYVNLFTDRTRAT